ncbi:MAG: hypothetical protein ABI356_04025 [Steroidobacteraceae bacterium]
MEDSPPPENLGAVEIKNFDHNGRPGRAWIGSYGEVSVAWILGLNRSLQVSSRCDDLPSYDSLVDFFARYRQAVITQDADVLADLTSSPLRIDPQTTEFINSKQIKSHFSQVFPDSLREVLADFDPHFVFCAHGHVAIAAGRIWAKPDAAGHLHVYFVDSHAHPLSTPLPIKPN